MSREKETFIPDHIKARLRQQQEEEEQRRREEEQRRQRPVSPQTVPSTPVRSKDEPKAAKPQVKPRVKIIVTKPSEKHAQKPFSFSLTHDTEKVTEKVQFSFTPDREKVQRKIDTNTVDDLMRSRPGGSLLRPKPSPTSTAGPQKVDDLMRRRSRHDAISTTKRQGVEAGIERVNELLRARTKATFRQMILPSASSARTAEVDQLMRERTTPALVTLGRSTEHRRKIAQIDSMMARLAKPNVQEPLRFKNGQNVVVWQHNTWVSCTINDMKRTNGQTFWSVTDTMNQTLWANNNDTMPASYVKETSGSLASVLATKLDGIISTLKQTNSEQMRGFKTILIELANELASLPNYKKSPRLVQAINSFT